MLLSAAATSNLIWVGVTLGLLVLIIVLSVWGSAARQQTARPSKRYEAHLRGLLADARAWSDASRRDLSDGHPLLAVVDATFAQAYMNVARTMGSDADVERAGNLRVDEFARQLADSSAVALQATTAVCPTIAPLGVAALKTGQLTPISI